MANEKISLKIEKLHKNKEIDEVEWVRLSCLNSISTKLGIISENINNIKNDFDILIDKKITENKKWTKQRILKA